MKGKILLDHISFDVSLNRGSLMADMISTLPDDVLCHILSFLSTEEAVSTMVLSKRWINLWLYVPVLDFDDEIYLIERKPYSRFLKFVYAVIVARVGLHQPLIKRFELISRVSESQLDHLYSDFKIWVNAAVNHGVEHLFFAITSLVRMKLPCCIFSCRTLVVLKLHHFHVHVFPSPHLPSLKTLDLNCTDFVEPWHLTEIMNACPILEDLELVNVDFDIKSGEGELKTLQRLVRVSIWNICYGVYYSSLEPFCNAEFLSIGAYTLPIPVFPNLRHVILAYEESQETWSQLFKMLMRCPKLQILEVLLPEEDYTTAHEVIHFPRRVPKCVSSQLRECILTDYKGLECELQLAKYIMQNSEFLQTMRIWIPSGTNPEEELKMLKELSTCPRRSATCELFCSIDTD